MSDSLFSSTNTTLDLNGPLLTFTTNPVGIRTNHLGSATLTGIATATFPAGQTERSSNTGNITYRWYRKTGAASSTALTDGTTVDGLVISGAGTTVLSLSNLKNPNDASAEFFLRADYIPSAYANGTTGNAIVDPKDSSVGIVTTAPLISIIRQPNDVVIGEGGLVGFSVVADTTDTSPISYQWRISGYSNIGNFTAGSNGPIFGVAADPQFIGIGSYVIDCVVSNSSAIPSQIISDPAILNIVETRAILAYEFVDSTWNGGGSKDLVSQGFLEFDANDPDERSISIYPVEKDIDVVITLAGSKGDAKNGNRGGYGGLSRFRMTLLQNVEYFIRLGVPYSVGSGDRGGVVGGGGASIFYRKANTVAVCGGGGGAGQNNRGGDGGGINVEGEDGVGRNGGEGAPRFNIGSLDPDGSFARTISQVDNETYTTNANNVVGGELSTCTVGDYWASQGFSQCQDLGTIQYRNSSGTVIAQTASISRGFKPGKSYRTNGGNGSGNQGGGGSGAFGGSAAITDGSGGGGGSGYSNGEITILNTQLGGHNDYGYIKIEEYGTTL